MSNADYQRDWRKRNAEAIRLHRQMLTALVRMRAQENQYSAWDLAKLLRECCGQENAAHIARWLQNPDAERPEVDRSGWDAVRAAYAALRGGVSPPRWGMKIDSKLIHEILAENNVEDHVEPLAVFVKGADGSEFTRVYTEEGIAQSGDVGALPAEKRITDGAGHTWHATIAEDGTVILL